MGVKYDSENRNWLLCSPLIYDPGLRREAWRFITYMFLHANKEHIIFNMLIQLFVGESYLLFYYNNSNIIALKSKINPEIQITRKLAAYGGHCSPFGSGGTQIVTSPVCLFVHPASLLNFLQSLGKEWY